MHRAHSTVQAQTSRHSTFVHAGPSRRAQEVQNLKTHDLLWLIKTWPQWYLVGNTSGRGKKSFYWLKIIAWNRRLKIKLSVGKEIQPLLMKKKNMQRWSLIGSRASVNDIAHKAKGHPLPCFLIPAPGSNSSEYLRLARVSSYFPVAWQFHDLKWPEV